MRVRSSVTEALIATVDKARKPLGREGETTMVSKRAKNDRVDDSREAARRQQTPPCAFRASSGNGAARGKAGGRPGLRRSTSAKRGFFQCAGDSYPPSRWSYLQAFFFDWRCSRGVNAIEHSLLLVRTRSIHRGGCWPAYAKRRAPPRARAGRPFSSSCRLPAGRRRLPSLPRASDSRICLHCEQQAAICGRLRREERTTKLLQLAAREP